jgi:hypothetical protein
MQEVVRGNARPKLDRSWPERFNALLTSCWARDPEKRPCFAEVIAELGSLMERDRKRKNQRLVLDHFFTV